MEKLTISQIKQELKERGFHNPTKEDINHWAIVLLLEEVIEIKSKE